MAVEHEQGDVELAAGVDGGVDDLEGLLLGVGCEQGGVHELDLPQRELLHTRVGVPARRRRAKPAQRRVQPEPVRRELVLGHEPPRHLDAPLLVPGPEGTGWGWGRSVSV